MPENAGSTSEKSLRRLDCAVLNFHLGSLESEGVSYDTVRCGFLEGKPTFEGSSTHRESHVQLAVRNPAFILGVFRPTMKGPR
jgi:hypothetical protein